MGFPDFVGKLVSACGLIAGDTTTTTEPPATTPPTPSHDRSLDESFELLELLDHWKQSALRREGLDEWKSLVGDALSAQVLDAMERGELPGGDCRIGDSPYFFDCEVAEQALNDFLDMERTGACKRSLRVWGSQNLDDVMERYFDIWAELNLTQRQIEWLEDNE